ncbi:MAG: hypothetical protein NUW09_00840, partial [Deltaproteobacteria bacterium]|nr:hypothetical protein [Deltaproteobacteria bacterium]
MAIAFLLYEPPEYPSKKIKTFEQEGKAMKRTRRIFFSRSSLAGIAAAVLISLLLPVKARAVSLYWVCGSDLWDNGSCWSLTAG